MTTILIVMTVIFFLEGCFMVWRDTKELKRRANWEYYIKSNDSIIIECKRIVKERDDIIHRQNLEIEGLRRTTEMALQNILKGKNA